MAYGTGRPARVAVLRQLRGSQHETTSPTPRAAHPPRRTRAAPRSERNQAAVHFPPRRPIRADETRSIVRHTLAQCVSRQAPANAEESRMSPKNVSRRWRFGVTVLIALSVAFAVGAASPSTGTSSSVVPGQTTGLLPKNKNILESTIEVNLTHHSATLPLHKGRFHGERVWYVITEASDEGAARDLNVNFAPKLANVGIGCPVCVQDGSLTTPRGNKFGEAVVHFQGSPTSAPGGSSRPARTRFRRQWQSRAAWLAAATARSSSSAARRPSTTPLSSPRALLRCASGWHGCAVARRGLRWRAPAHRTPPVAGGVRVRRWRCRSGCV